MESSASITANNLVGLIGLQVFGDGAGNNHGMSELMLNHGAIMMVTSLIENCEPTRVTDWTFESSNESPRCQSNETLPK